MAEREILLDAIFISRMHRGRSRQTAAALGILGLQQMPFAGAGTQNFASGRNLEAFGRGFLSLNAFGTSHNYSVKKSAQYTDAEG